MNNGFLITGGKVKIGTLNFVTGDDSFDARTSVQQSTLVNELDRLLKAVEEKALDESKKEEVHFVSAAKEAAENGDEDGVLENLKKVSVWVLQTARDIGVSIVAKLIESRLLF